MTLQLQELMATTATGWAAVIGGVLNVRTVTDTANACALNALYAGGFPVLATCQDPGCDCLVKLMKQLMPDAQLVQVAVKVAEAEHV